ncbi:MAG: hypothetical protein MK086_05980 [Flavobacteriales bacterium]|nr:hypothetical protein [Flavobacteriales bacterium]
MLKADNIGVLITGKRINQSNKELLDAARLMNEGDDYSVTILSRKSRKIRRFAEEAGLNTCSLKKIIDQRDFNASLKFSELLKEEEISTIIFRDFESTGLLVSTKFLLKGRLRLVLVQDQHLSDIDTDVLSTFRFNQIDAWVTPVNHTANSVKALTNLSPRKIHVFSMPVPRKPFSFDEDDRNIRKTILFEHPNYITVGWSVPRRRDLLQRTGRSILQLLRMGTGVKICLNLRYHSEGEFFAEIPELKSFSKEIIVTEFDTQDADMYGHLDFLFVDVELEPFSGIVNRAIIAEVVPIASKSLVSNELLLNGELGILTSELGTEPVPRNLSESTILSEFRSRLNDYVGIQFTKKRFKENLEALLESLPAKADAR